MWREESYMKWVEMKKGMTFGKGNKLSSQFLIISVATPFLEECEDDTHIPEMGTWESSETLETSEQEYRGQNTSHCGVCYIIGKL